MLDKFSHGKYIKDFRQGKIDWTVTEATHSVGGQMLTKLSETTEAKVRTCDTGIEVLFNKPLDFAACDKMARSLPAGQIYEHDPKLNGQLSDDVDFSGTLPITVPTEGDEVFDLKLLAFKLHSNTENVRGRRAFAYLTEFTADKWRRFHGKSNGTEFFTNQISGETPFFWLELDDDCPHRVEDAFDAYCFALNFFYGTRIKWSCRAIRQDAEENTEFRLFQPAKAIRFETPVNWSIMPKQPSDQRQLSDEDALSALQQFANYYLKHGYTAVICLLEYCWELSIDAQIYSRILAIAVAIEGISNDVLKSKEAQKDLAYEELIDKIQKDLIADWIKNAPDEGTKKLRKAAKGRFVNAVARRNELGGRMLVKAAFDSVSAPCSEEETKLWSTARNKAAHPNLKEKDSIGDVNDDYFALIDMLYRLVLTHMGYTGERIDYSVVGHLVTKMR
jgi:hypothetical protein